MTILASTSEGREVRQTSQRQYCEVVTTEQDCTPIRQSRECIPTYMCIWCPPILLQYICTMSLLEPVNSSRLPFNFRVYLFLFGQTSFGLQDSTSEMSSMEVIPWYYYYFFGALEPVCHIKHYPSPRNSGRIVVWKLTMNVPDQSRSLK